MDPAAHITCFIGAVAPLVTGRQRLSILTVYTLRLVTNPPGHSSNYVHAPLPSIVNHPALFPCSVCVPHDSRNTQHSTKTECVLREECLNLHIILRNFQASNIELRDSTTFPPYQIDIMLAFGNFWKLCK